MNVFAKFDEIPSMILEVIKETKRYGHTEGRSDDRTTLEQYTLPQTQFAGGITMMGWSPLCYIPRFVEIGLPVLEKKISKGFLPYMGMAAILGHVTSIMSSDFHFLVPESFHTKFNLDRQSSF